MASDLGTVVVFVCRRDATHAFVLPPTPFRLIIVCCPTCGSAGEQAAVRLEVAYDDHS